MSNATAGPIRTTLAKIFAPKNAAVAPPATAPEKLAASPPKKNAATSDEIPTSALRAWQSPTMNTRILIAYPPGSDPTNPNNLVTVRVANNKNFIRHMQLRARRVENSTYDLVGPLPRWKGRW